jgi:hypothetical protein
MDRVLGLQALSEFGEPDLLSEGCSGTSNVCSSSSGGTGDSGCSVRCGGSEELDW